MNDKQGNIAEKSCSEIYVTNNINMSKDNITKKTTTKEKAQNKNKDTKEQLGVTAVIPSWNQQLRDSLPELTNNLCRVVLATK